MMKDVNSRFINSGSKTDFPEFFSPNIEQRSNSLLNTKYPTTDQILGFDQQSKFNYFPGN